MKSNYPKFLKSKILIMGFRIDDIYVGAVAVLLLNLLGISQTVTIGLVAGIIFALGVVRRMFPRDHFYFYVKSLRKERWYLFNKNNR